MFNFFLEQSGGAGELAPQFRALEAPSEVLSWVLSIHSRSSQTPETGSRGSDISGLLGYLHTHEHTHTDTHTYT